MNPWNLNRFGGQIPDKDRSCYGLGYEYRRRKQDIERNPFATDSPQWQWFRDGWLAKREVERKPQ